jgi:hypothetical protein
MKQQNLPTNERERLEMAVGALLDNLRQVVRALDETEDLQWLSPSGHGRLEAGYSDPTGETVVDFRRLSLRSARKLATLEIADMVKRLDGLLARFDRAVAPYEGSTDETG